MRWNVVTHMLHAMRHSGLLGACASRFLTKMERVPTTESRPSSSWPSNFPSQDAIRRECDAMLEAYASACIDHFGARLKSIFFKGSSIKVWDSSADYVPDVSDVDIHLVLHDGADSGFRDCEDALALNERAEERFFATVRDPLHVPKAQILILTDTLLGQEDFVGSPVSSIVTRYGDLPHPARILDQVALKALDCQSLISGGDISQVRFLEPSRLADKASKSLRIVLRDLGWRIGPIPSRAVSALGGDFEFAWGSNRTTLLLWLEQHGEQSLAMAVRRFYDASWAYFLSRDLDGRHGREAVRSAIEAMNLSVDLGKRVLST